MKKTQTKKGIEKYSKQLIAIAVALVVIIGGSYAWLTLTLSGSKSNVIKAGTLSMTLDESTTEGITIENAVPTKDSVGEQSTAYTFKVKNNGNIPSVYSLYLNNVPNDEAPVDTLGNPLTLIDPTLIRYRLDKTVDGTVTNGTIRSLQTLESSSRKIYVENADKDVDYELASDAEVTYTLRIWIDENATNTVMGQAFAAKVGIEASQIQQ